MDSSKCQTATASPAEPGELPVVLDMLPSPALARLQQSVADNSQRIEAMIAESAAIQRAFQKAGLSYAVLKGFSLWPVSFSKYELRSQLDLDFLVSEGSANEARRILEQAGYRLHAISCTSWEFTANEGRTTSLKQLYKAGMSRSAELHVEATGSLDTSLLSRTIKLCFRGVCRPVLSPIDIFVGQGLHLFKHVCSKFSRTAHLIEFRRHVIARYYDDAFWSGVERQVGSDPKICLRLGAVILIISRLMGSFAPSALTHWTVDQVPAATSLWIDHYAKPAMLMRRKRFSIVASRFSGNN